MQRIVLQICAYPLAYRVELLEVREVSHHAALALLPSLLLLGAVDLDARDADQVLQVVVPTLLAQALVLRRKQKTIND